MSSELIRHDFSGHLNTAELQYRNDIQPGESEYASEDKWLERLNDGRRHWPRVLTESIDLSGEILELGAGGCWFGSELSRLDRVNKVYCLEMSEHLLVKVAPVIMQAVGAQTHNKCEVGLIPFPGSSPLEDGSGPGAWARTGHGHGHRHWGRSRWGCWVREG